MFVARISPAVVEAAVPTPSEFSCVLLDVCIPGPLGPLGPCGPCAPVLPGLPCAPVLPCGPCGP